MRLHNRPISDFAGIFIFYIQKLKTQCIQSYFILAAIISTKSALLSGSLIQIIRNWSMREIAIIPLTVVLVEVKYTDFPNMPYMFSKEDPAEETVSVISDILKSLRICQFYHIF